MLVYGSTPPARPLFVAQGDNVWCGSPLGLFRYQSESELWSPVFGYAVTDLVVDDNILWAGTNQGLYYADFKYLNWKSYGKAQGLASDSVIAVSADVDYVYAAGPHGLVRMDKLVGQWETLGDFGRDTIHDMVSDQDNLWIATDRGIDRFFKQYQKWEHYDAPKGPAQRAALRVFYFKGALWVLLESGFLRYNDKMKSWSGYGAKDGLPEEGVERRVVDASYLWIVTVKGVMRFNGENETWENFAVNTPLATLKVNDLSVSGNLVYFATDEGVYSYNEDTRKWTLYTQSDGLCSDEQERILAISNFAIAFQGNVFNVYRASEDVWFNKRVAILGGSAAPSSWKSYADERGVGLTTPGGENINLLGRAFFKMKHKAEISSPLSTNIPDYLSNPVDARFRHYQYWWEKAQLHLNGDLKNGRNVLGSFDNTDPSGDIRYVAGFTGNTEDRLRSAQISDKQKTDYFYSSLIRPSYLEGGGVRTQFGGRVGEKKRSRVNSGVWVGKHKTSYLTRLIPFQEDNFYFLGKGNLLTESVVLKVDGRVVDGRDYSIERTMGILTFKDDSRVSPESRIEISFQYEPSLEDYTGDIASVDEVTVLSDHVAIGGTGILRRFPEPNRSGTGSGANQLATGSVNGEVEYKSRDGKRLFRAYPEISVSTNDSILYEKQGNAAGLKMNAVVDKLRLKAEGRMLTDNYESVTEDWSVYGRVKQEMAAEAVYDVTPEMPVTLWARGIEGGQGNERSGSLEYLFSPAGRPSLTLKGLGQRYSHQAAGSGVDSLNRKRLNGRVESEWDVSSALSEKLFMNRIFVNTVYDLDLIGTDSLRQHEDRRNHNLFARLRVSPHSKVMLETKGVFRYSEKDDGNGWRIGGRRTRPEFTLYSQELIPGVTTYGRYRLDNAYYFPKDTTLRSREERFNGNVLLVPGVWSVLLNSFQINVAYSLSIKDSAFSAVADTTMLQRTTQGVTFSPVLYPTQDIRILNRSEFTRQDDFRRQSAKGIKINNDFDFYFRNRKTNLLFEYDYSRDSSRDTSSDFVSSSNHQIQTKWAERWKPGLRTEFKIGASHQAVDTLAVGSSDGFFTNVLLDFRTTRFVREFRVQERLGPNFYNGRGWDFGSYEFSFENKLDVSLKVGRNLYARLFLNLTYYMHEQVLKYDMAEFKLTALF